MWDGFTTPPVSLSSTTAVVDHWRSGAISSIAWSEHRPSVFFVLDAAASLYFFDLLEDDTGPLGTEPCPSWSAGPSDHPEKNGNYAEGPDKTARKPGENNGTIGQCGKMCWAPPILALSGDTLIAGSRPRVAVSARGTAFTRGLERKMFASSSMAHWPTFVHPAAERTTAAAVAAGEGGGEGKSHAEGRGDSGSERDMMEKWLRTVLWEG